MDPAKAWPATIIINNVEHRGRRDMDTEKVLVPYTEKPDIGSGDVIVEKQGQREISLKVIDVGFQDGGTLEIGTRHKNLMTLKVENITAELHKAPTQTQGVTIGTMSGGMVQVGNENLQIAEISIQQLTEKIAASDDPEAKSALRKLLENSTVGSLLGAGAGFLLALL